jgi:cytochrome c-type biogenesis protein CcmH
MILPMSAFAVEPDEVLADPVLEERARVISKELRCVVCKNQDIDSSNAGVARDLRLLVRERLVEGDTNDEVIAFIRARYGDFVLLKPPFKPETYLLWFAPPALALFALLIGIMVLRQSHQRKDRKLLSDADEAEVERILATVEREANS